MWRWSTLEIMEKRKMVRYLLGAPAVAGSNDYKCIRRKLSHFTSPMNQVISNDNSWILNESNRFNSKFVWHIQFKYENKWFFSNNTHTYTYTHCWIDKYSNGKNIYPFSLKKINRYHWLSLSSFEWAMKECWKILKWWPEVLSLIYP